jgi:phosphorylated CTD-interacting factor 1
MQGACHDKVFDVLQEHLIKTTTTASTTAFSSSGSSSILECFASPLNAHLPHFASAFYDVDWHFGSMGNFFSVDNFYAKVGGLHQANPPFSPGLMKRMADTMIHHLTLADDEQHYDTALCFVVIVPTVHLDTINATITSTAQSNSAGRHEEKEEEYESLVKRFAKPSFETLVASPFCRLHIILPAREHGYLVGAQHVRPTQYKQSNYDTSVILLQSRRARETMTFDAQRLEGDIRKAFASREEAETEQRRQAKRVKTQRES